MRLITGNFLENYDPTIEDSHHHRFNVDGKEYNIDVLDTAGQQDFRALEDSWFQIGEGFLLAYSITSRGSFDEITGTYDRLVRSKDVPPPIVLCGNKSDLEPQREVPTADGTKLAAKWGCQFFETSAKLSKNEEVFAELVRATIKRKQPVTKKAKGCVLL